MRIGQCECSSNAPVELVFGVAACSSQPAPPPSGPPATSTSAFTVDEQTARENAFTLFESGQGRPLALSEDGRFLYATNTPVIRRARARRGPTRAARVRRGVRGRSRGGYPGSLTAAPVTAIARNKKRAGARAPLEFVTRGRGLALLGSGSRPE